MYKLVVLFSVLALAAAEPKPNTVVYSGVPAAIGYSSLGYGASVVPAVYGAGYAPYVSGVVPYTALAQAPNSPAVVLDAVNKVPLDTPEVVAARIAHYQAKALSGVHTIAKRSVVAPVAYSSVVPVSSVSPVHSVVSPVGYSSPFVTSYTASVGPYTYAGVPVVPRALSVHPW